MYVHLRAVQILDHAFWGIFTPLPFSRQFQDYLTLLALAKDPPPTARGDLIFKRLLTKIMTGSVWKVRH